MGYLITEIKLRRKTETGVQAGRPQLRLSWGHSCQPCLATSGQPKGSRGSLAICLEVKPARGNASNVSQPVTEPENVKKNPLVHVLSADKSVIGSGTALSPEGEGTAPTVEMATMDDWGGLEIPAALPTMRYLSLLRSPG